MAKVDKNNSLHEAAWEAHFAALDGGGDGRWQELTAKELCKLLAMNTLGLGSPMHQINEAAKKVGFDKDNVVFIKPGIAHVVTLIQFTEDGEVASPDDATETA